MNGFQSCRRGISSQESVSTIGKKIANSMVGKSSAEPPVGTLPRVDGDERS